MLSITLLTLAALLFGSANRPPVTHIITLFVNTRTIEKSNVNEVCNFDQEEGVTNEDFTTLVKLGDLVIWRGISVDAPDEDEVLISAINHEGGARVFGKNVLKDSRDNPGVVEAVVTEGKAGDEEKYKLSFKVLNNGEKRGGTYHIDPRIRVRDGE